MFHGSLVAIVTPMKEQGDVDFAAFERLIDWHLESGTDGIVVLGTTGEAATIEGRERPEIIRAVVKQVNERVPVIVGSGVNSTKLSIELTQQAMELGADAALLVTPYYNKPTQEGLYQHYKTISEAVPIPQILYNVPARTAVDMLPETVKRLGHLPNIVALKEATGDLTRLKEILDLECDIDMLSGDDKTGMEFILAGGKGMISVTANVFPKEMHEMCQAALAGDRPRAEEINNTLEIWHESLFLEPNPIPAKWVLAQMGKIESGIRLPLTVLNEKFHQNVRKLMQQSNLNT